MVAVKMNGASIFKPYFCLRLQQMEIAYIRYAQWQ